MVDAEFLNTQADAQAAENRLVNLGLTKLPPPVVSGMTLGADISLCDVNGNTILTFNKVDTDTATAGVVWVVNDIDGWWTLPEPELPDLPRGWGDGSYDSRGRFTARNLSLAGTFLTQSPSQVPAARAKLVKAIDLVYKGGWLVVNESPAKSAFVRLSGRPEIATVNARGRTEFSVGLKASDPIKYEWLTTGTGIVEGYRKVSLTAETATTITNTGNTRVPVIFEINGPTTGTKTIKRAATNTTALETITIVNDIPTGNKLTIDTLNREVLLEDADGVVTNARNYISTLSDWIFLGADPDTTNGASSITATVACDVFYRSGWIA